VELAKQQPEREHRLDGLLVKREELEHEHDQLLRVYEQAQIAYDATEHATVKRQVSDVGQKLAASKAQLEEKETRLGVVKQSIGQLESLEKELATKTAAAAETAELLAMTETVREILREAGPYVTRRLVRQISARASTIYGDLMGNPERRLRWSDDYQISLNVRGHDRTFPQLSGGERMAAAIALRLGLMQETSNIGIVFLDEPTEGLDQIRCGSLSERIMQVKGLSQIFVISHNSTFEAATENVIGIVKDETGSHVMNGGGEAP